MSTLLAGNTFEAFEHRGWQRSAERYSHSFTSLTSQTIPRILELLAVTRQSTLLDIACGPGNLTEAAIRCGWSVTALDFSEAMVEKTRQRCRDAFVIEGNAEELPEFIRGFDAVAMNFGMLHLGSPEKAMAEAYRALNQEGRFAFTVWAPPSEALGFAIVLGAVENYGTQVDLPSGPPFFKFSNPATAEECLAAAGFSDVTAEKLPLFWELPSPKDFFLAFYEGTPRTGGLLRAQPPEALEQIRSAVEQEVATRFGTGEGTVRIPMPAMLYSGKR